FGAGTLPTAGTVIQAGDQVYLAAISGLIAEALAIAAMPPTEDPEA
ncbi:MAG: TrkA family potassium uptake protein, partial [Mycobacterium sp.]